jgi:DNA-binding transcriptional regulator YhcF (GntR family)
MRRTSIDRPSRKAAAKTLAEPQVVSRRQESALAAAPGTPVGEMTYRRVRADIVYGRLAPGQKLTLDRMRDAYGSAVSTLREIFNGLASEGLITAEGARGFEVASISRDNLRDRRMRQLSNATPCEARSGRRREWSGASLRRITSWCRWSASWPLETVLARPCVDMTGNPQRAHIARGSRLCSDARGHL